MGGTGVGGGAVIIFSALFCCSVSFPFDRLERVFSKFFQLQDFTTGPGAATPEAGYNMLTNTLKHALHS